MTSNKFIIALFLLISTFTYSQADSLIVREIDMKSNSIDKNLGQILEKLNFEIDSASVSTEKFNNKIIAKTRFKKSEIQLTTEFYYNSNNLILIRFTEPSPKFKTKKDANKITEYYYENSKLIDEHFSLQIPSAMFCVSIPTYNDWDEVYGYNTEYSSDFLNSLANKILNKITD